MVTVIPVRQPNKFSFQTAIPPASSQFWHPYTMVLPRCRHSGRTVFRQWSDSGPTVSQSLPISPPSYLRFPVRFVRFMRFMRVLIIHRGCIGTNPLNFNYLKDFQSAYTTSQCITDPKQSSFEGFINKIKTLEESLSKLS